MDSLELLKKAIEDRKPISFEYNRDGRAIGTRYANPHAIYISSTDKINVHIWKTDGVKTDPSQPLPDWRSYTLNYFEEVKVFDDRPQFNIAPGYKPNSPFYSRAIAKV